MPRIVDIEGLGPVEVADEIGDNQLVEFSQAFKQGSASSFLDAVARTPGMMIGKGLQGIARAAEVVPDLVPARKFNPFSGQIGEQISLEEPPKPPAEESSLYQFGKNLEMGAQEAFPVNPAKEDSFATAAATGIGSFGATIIPGVGDVIYAGSAGEDAYQEAGSIIDSKIRDAELKGDAITAENLKSSKQRLQRAAFLAAAPIGAVSERTLGFATRLPGIVTKGARAPISRIVAEGIVREGTQEFVEQVTGNAAAKIIYDETRPVFEGAGTAAGAGGVAGGFFGTVGGAIGKLNRAERLRKIQQQRLNVGRQEVPGQDPLTEAIGSNPGNPLPNSSATVAGMADSDALTPDISEAEIAAALFPEGSVLAQPAAAPAAPAPAVETIAEAPEATPVVPTAPAAETPAAPISQPKPITPDAVQEQGADEGVLRGEVAQPEVEVGLPEVDQGGRPTEGGGTQPEVQVEAEAVTPPPVVVPALEPQAAPAPVEPIEPPQKKANEELEAQIVKETAAIIRDDRTANVDPEETYDKLTQRYEAQPELGERTATSKTAQAYSTPAPLAYLAGILADVQGGKKIAETTAGNGMLLVGADPNTQEVIANELDPNRRQRLEQFIGKPATGTDAASQEFFNQLDQAKPDRVIINPPFGTRFIGNVRERFPIFRSTIKRADTPSLDLAIALNTLETMTPDGRAVIILGSKTGSQSARIGSPESRLTSYERAEYLDLFNRFNVTDFFTLDGSLYSKMGAGWPVDVVVINGKRPTPPAAQGGLVRPWISAPRVYNNWADLKELIYEARQAKPAAPVTAPATGVGGGVAPQPAAEGGAGQPGGIPGAPAGTQLQPEGQRAGLPGERAGGAERGPAGAVAPGQPAVAPRQPEERGPVAPAAPAVTEPGAAGGVAPGRPVPVAVAPSARPGLTKNLSAEDQARLEALKAELRSKLGGVSIGIDPTILTTGAQMAALYVKAGIKRFFEFAAQVREDLPDIWDKLKRSLLAIWQETANQVQGLDDLNRTEANAIIDQIDAATVPTEPVVEEPADVEPEAAEMSEARTKPYQSQSKNAETGLVSPANIADATSRALKELEAEVKMPVDNYVADRLQMTREQLFATMSAAQIDAAALAIRNIERGSALINSDQTGVGKGRTVAAVLRYARLNGLVPVFVTAKPTLYSDMAGRDLPAIGERDIRPYITNSKETYVASNGETVKISRTSGQTREELQKVSDTSELPAGTNALFTTYDQLKADVPAGFKETAKTRRARQGKRIAKPFGPIWSAISRIAPNAIFVLDEAHLAAGANSDTNIRFDQILPKSKGAYFASATFAKRPDNLGLYALKTLMQRSGLSNTEMVELLNSGGLALQQALTSMLAESGEFIRRQQNWDGVPFEFVTATENAERERELADVYTDFLQQIYRFSKQIAKVAKKLENAENQTRASEEKVSFTSTNFGSLLFNLSSQYILSLKAQAIADSAIEVLRKNEKPFIAINNTMEGPIENLKAEGFDVSYKGMLLRQLEKLLEVQVKDKAADKKTTVKLRPDELPAEAREIYENIKDEIEGADFGDMPISPIDFIKERISKAGYTIDEITGRGTEVVTGPKGEVTSVPRKKRDRRVVLDDFNNGRLDALLVNKSGSTGTSAHTDPKFKDQRRRAMIVGQAAPDINDFMQMLGRIMRYGQTSLPRYVVLSSSLAAENRFMVLLRRKMASLNANTSADTESELTANEGLVADVFNSIGDDVVYNVLKSNPDIVDRMGISLPDYEEDLDQGGDFARSVTGYFVILPDDYVARLWGQISELYNDRIRALDEVGENPLKANVDDIRAKVIDSGEFTPGTGTTPFDGPSTLERVSIKPAKAPPTFDSAIEEAIKNRATAEKVARAWLQQSKAFEERRVQEMTQREVNPVQIQSVRDAFRETRDAVVSAFGRIGKVFKNQFGYVAVPIDLKLKANDPGNFTRPSDQQLVLTRNMIRSRASMPLSMSEGEGSALGQEIDNGAEEWASTVESTDERFVVTGNLLKGFKSAQGASESRPKITIYTTNTGARKTGIMMPSGFKPETRIKDIRINQNDAVRLLGEGTEVFVKLRDASNSVKEMMRLTPEADNKIKVKLRSSNQLRPTWSNREIQALFPGNLTQSGVFFVGEMDRSNLDRFLTLTRQSQPELGELMYDKVESLLNKAIQATRPQGVYESTAAIPLAVLNLALRAARAVYIKTRDMIQARKAAMDYIRENAPSNVDLAEAEAEVGKLLEGAFETPGVGPIETPEVQAPRAAAGERRRPSQGFFRGRIVRETDAERKTAAREWVDQFGDDIEGAFTAATSGNRATDFGITPAILQTILGELIQRTALRMQAAPNEIDRARWRTLLQNLAEFGAQSGAQDFGQSGQARREMLNTIDYLAPVLTHLNLINERQKELPFPDVVSDQIRTWLLESSKRAIKNLKATLSQADAVVQRELKSAKAELGVSWEEIMTSSLDQQGNYKRLLLAKMINHPVLKTLSRAGQIELANLLGNAFEKERNKIVRQEFKKQIKLPNVSKKVQDRIYNAIPDIIKWANLGLLTNPEAAASAFRNAIAPRFGVAQFDGPTATKINELAQKAQRVGGVNRKKLITQMYQIMQKDGGIRARNIIMDYWYASVLSGLTTAVEQGTGIINSVVNAGLASVKNPTAAPYIASAWLDGMRRGAKDFPDIFLKGEGFQSINFNQEQPLNSLEGLKDSDNLALKAITSLRYVQRFMDAMDHIAVTSNYEAMKAWILAREGSKSDLFKYLEPTADDIRLAREKAQEERTPERYMNKRINEILQDRIPTEVVISAMELARQAAFKQDPSGVVGLFYQWLNQAEKRYPGLKMVTGLAFLRFAANATNAGLDWVPWGFMRYWLSSGSRINKPFGYQIDANERKLLILKASIGTAMMAFAGALFLGDDDKEEDRAIDITGSFKSLSTDKRRQLLAQGKQPYSIRFGNTYVSYRQMPFAMGLSAIGELRDQQLHNPEKWNQEGILGKFNDSAKAGMFVITDSPAISSFTELIGVANAYKYSSDDAVLNNLSRWSSRLAGSFIPNVAKQIDTWSDPNIYPAKVGTEYFLQQVPWARREVGVGPALNVLGEPVEVMKHPFSRWIKTRKEDPAWTQLSDLASKGIFMPVPSATAKVKENGQRRPMTPTEAYRYQKEVGQAYRQYILDNGRRLNSLPAEKAAEAIDKETRRIRERIQKNIDRSIP